MLLWSDSDPHADPLVIPSLASGLADGAWIDVELALANGRLHPLVSRSDESKTRRDFALACSIASAAATASQISLECWFSPHFAVRTDCSIAAWDATVDMTKDVLSSLALSSTWFVGIAPVLRQIESLVNGLKGS